MDLLGLDDRNLQIAAALEEAGRHCAAGGTAAHPLRSADCRYAFPFPVRSYARYRGPIARALLHLKYRPNRALAQVMGGWLAAIVRRDARQRGHRVRGAGRTVFGRGPEGG